VIETKLLTGQYNWNRLRKMKFDDGWRLPTVFELIEIRKQSPDENYYWSSSPHAYYLYASWGISFIDGLEYNFNKINSFAVYLIYDEQNFDYWHPVSIEEFIAYKQHGILPDWHPEIAL